QAAGENDTNVPPPPTAASNGGDPDHSRTTTATSISSPAPSTHPSSAEYIVSGIKQHRVAAGIAGGVLVLVIAAIGLGLYKFIGAKKSASPPTPKLQFLTTSGKASDAAISPDGEYVALITNDPRPQRL